MNSQGQRSLEGTEAHPGLKTLIAFSMADEYVLSMACGIWREVEKIRGVDMAEVLFFGVRHAKHSLGHRSSLLF